MKWRDIKTAPKDGTPVLVYGAWVGELYDNYPAGAGVASCEYGNTWTSVYCEYYGVSCNPTHWMPLPKIPVDAPQPNP